MTRRRTMRLLFTLVFSFSMVVGGTLGAPVAIAEDAGGGAGLLVGAGVGVGYGAADVGEQPDAVEGAGEVGALEGAPAVEDPAPAVEAPVMATMLAAPPVEGDQDPGIEALTPRPHLGNIYISKTFFDSAGEPIDSEDLPEDLAITVHVDGPGPEWDRTVMLDADNDWSTVLHDMRLGNYFIHEEPLDGFVPEYWVDGEPAHMVHGSAKLELEESGHDEEPVDTPIGTVEIRNTHVPDGSLTITKEFRDYLGEVMEPAEDASVTVRVTGPGEFEEEFKLSDDNDWTKTFDELITGHYLVEELTTGDFITTYEIGEASSEDGDAHVMDGEAIDLIIANTEEPDGSLTISKEYRTYLGVPIAPAEDASVTVRVTGPDDYDEEFKLDVDNDWMVTLTGLMPGEYLVDELTTGNFVASYEVGEDVDDEGVVDVEDGESSEILVVNTFNPGQTVPGAHTVDKVANVATAKPGDTITYTVTVRNTGEAPISGLPISDSLVAPAVTFTPQILPGATWSFSYTYKVPVPYTMATVANTVNVGGVTDAVTVTIVQPAPSAPVTPTTTTTTSTPKTGDDIRLLLGYGALVAIAAVAAIATARRRQAVRTK